MLRQQRREEEEGLLCKRERKEEGGGGDLLYLKEPLSPIIYASAQERSPFLTMDGRLEKRRIPYETK